MPLSIGTKLGPYEIVAPLGAGGMGEVFRARDTRLHRTVAIKVLPHDRVADLERKRRFLQEARAASALNHPNIVTLYDIASEDGIDYLVLEYVPGKSLDKIISSKRIPLDEALGYATQIAAALVAAHAAGIVHRDIKPANVMVTPEGHVKVLDFGLAKLAEPVGIGLESETRTLEPSLTEAEVVMGTIAYMAPEQARAEQVDARADLFSFGTVLYEMFTGRRAFPKRLDWTPPPTQGLPPELQHMVLTLLEADREQRYQTAAELLADLQGLRDSPSNPARRWWPWVAVAAMAVVAVGAFLWLHPNRGLTGQSQWMRLTNLSDSVSQPALSPDGRMLTFLRSQDTFWGLGQVYIKLLPDGEPVQLTHDNLPKMGPVFSPDGSRIAYTTVDRSFGWDTWVVPVLSGQPERWLANASGLTWAGPNRLLFSEIKRGIHMAVVSSAESRVGERDVYVPPNEQGMAHRSYASPDGKSVLLVEMDQASAWVPCRLVPMDGSSPGRQVGPPGAGCTSAAWSPDGKWMYMSSGAGGSYHIWRQRFPDGQPEQVTAGPTEEEGIAVASDGRSLVTAVALEQSSVWVHDLNGDSQISLEGAAFNPHFTPDGKSLCYVILKGSLNAVGGQPSELWIANLETGHKEPLLPGFPILNYSISRDGRQVVVQALDPSGKSRLWLVPLNRRSPPRQIPNVEGQEPAFGPGDEVFFIGPEGTSRFPYRVRADGTELRKASEQHAFHMGPVARDGHWFVAFGSLPGPEDTAAWQAFPLDGGSPVEISAPGTMSVSPDASLLSYEGPPFPSGETYIVPLPEGPALPPFPRGGFHSEQEISRLPGARLVHASGVSPGLSVDVYAFTRQSVQRNLYRIPLP